MEKIDQVLGEPVAPEVEQAIWDTLRENTSLGGWLDFVSSTNYPTQYIHVGRPVPSILRDLTAEEQQTHAGKGYVKFEELDPTKGGTTKGIFWTQSHFDRIHKGCGLVSSMSPTIAEAFHNDYRRFGTLYCQHCGQHLQVGSDGYFVWADTGLRVG